MTNISEESVFKREKKTGCVCWAQCAVCCHYYYCNHHHHNNSHHHYHHYHHYWLLLCSYHCYCNVFQFVYIIRYNVVPVVYLGKWDAVYRHGCVDNWSICHILWTWHTQYTNVWKCVQIDGQTKGCAWVFVISCDCDAGTNHKISSGYDSICWRLLSIQFQIYRWVKKYTQTFIRFVYISSTNHLRVFFSFGRLFPSLRFHSEALKISYTIRCYWLLCFSVYIQ